MAFIPLITAGAGLAGNLLQGKSGKAASQAQGQINQSESTAIDDLMKQYFGPNGAAQTMATLTPKLLSWINNPTSDPAFNSLTTALGAQGNSTVKTLQGDEGYGTANPGALATRLFGQSNQQAGQTAAESIGSQQSNNLSGLQSIFGAQGSGLGQALGTSQALSNQYGQKAASAGNAFGSLGSLASAIAGLTSGSGSNATSSTVPNLASLFSQSSAAANAQPSNQSSTFSLQAPTGAGSPYGNGFPTLSGGPSTIPGPTTG